MDLYRQIAEAVFVMAVLLAGAKTSPAAAQAAAQAKSAGNAECRVENVDYKGWQAQQISNRWVQLIIVPQNGGRLMQVSFNGHAYLFVNPKLAGKYMPPSQDQWFNYGGDKLWLLPEGDDDEQHWRGNSDLLDDGPFNFRKLSDGHGMWGRTYRIAGCSDWGSVFTKHSPGPRHASYLFSRLDEKRERPHGRVGDSVGFAVRHRQLKGSLTQQSRDPGIHSVQSIQWILESLSRSHRSRRKPCGNR